MAYKFGSEAEAVKDNIKRKRDTFSSFSNDLKAIFLALTLTLALDFWMIFDDKYTNIYWYI